MRLKPGRPDLATHGRLFAVPGAMCWHEVYTRDPATTDRFYDALFDYTRSAPIGAPEGGCASDMGYAVYNRGGHPVFGRMHMTSAPTAPETAVWFERVYAFRNGRWMYLSHRTVNGPTQAGAGKSSTR